VPASYCFQAEKRLVGAASFYPSGLPIVGVAPNRRVHRGINWDLNAGQNPRALARSKARRQQSIIDFPRYGEAVKQHWRQIKPGIVRKPIRRGFDVALCSGDDAVVVRGYASHFGGIGIEEPPLKVSDLRLERGRPLVDIEIDLLCETTGNTPFAKFSLDIETGVHAKLVGIARQVGVVADDLRFVLFTARSLAGNDRLKFADFAFLEGVGGFPEIVHP
jgi:hypothetical protein